MRFPRRFLAVPAFAVLMLVATPLCQSAMADGDGDIDENIADFSSLTVANPPGGGVTCAPNQSFPCGAEESLQRLDSIFQYPSDLGSGYVFLTF